jgi:cell division protein FtsI/penicillin-binding protein 2
MSARHTASARSRRAEDFGETVSSPFGSETTLWLHGSSPGGCRKPGTYAATRRRTYGDQTLYVVNARTKIKECSANRRCWGSTGHKPRNAQR